MAFPQVRSTVGGSEGNGTAPTYSLPATIEAGDLILLIAGTDSTATFTQPAGYTLISQQNATEFQVQVFGKIAVGDEDSTTIDGTLSASESTCFRALVIQDWSGDIDDVDVNTIVTGTGASADPGTITATWGSADNLFIAVAIGDDYNKIATAWPTNYADNQLTQSHASAFGGNQAVSVCTRELASASDDPSAFTLATTANSNVFAAFGIVVRPAAGPSLVIDDAPAEIRSSDTGLTITVSGVTASNITNISQVAARLVDASGPQLTPTAYNYTSATVVEITFSVPFPLSIQYDSTGYAVYLDLNTETISTSAIPYLPVSTKDFINLAGTIVKSVAWVSGGNYVDTTEVYDPNDNLVYTSNGVTNSTTAPNADAVNFTYLRPHQSLADGWDEDEPVVGTQAVPDILTANGSTITPAADGTYTISPAATETDTFTVFFIEADGTVGDPATITIDAGASGSSETPVLKRASFGKHRIYA